MNTYIVQSGDTLYGIAKKFNTSVRRIQEDNNLKDTTLIPGEKIKIYEMSDNNPTECVTYTVKKGDNLYSIARKYDTTIEEIKRYNNLTNNNLSINQKITIPCYNEKININTKPNYISYLVKKGDTLYSIAKKYGTNVEQIKKDNNLSNNNLEIGTNILILDNNKIESFEECYGEDYMSNTDYNIYIVKKGDSLYSIAKKFNVSVSEIKNLNMLSNDNLSIGEELKIPTSLNNTDGKYIVQKGESLYSIAKKFNTTVDEIKRKNNLTNNLITIGDVLNV